MTEFIKKLSIRWSDLDPNFHLRHTAYYDFGAQQRVEILMANGITQQVMQQEHFGPILFREECVFRKEIRFTDNVFLKCEVSGLRADASRWRILHQFLSDDQTKILAVLTVEGAWIDTNLRKLVSPVPSIILKAMSSFPRSADFLEM